MSNLLTKQTFAAMLQGASRKIDACVDELNQLDSAIGDGDHGVSISKAIRAAAKSLAEAPFEQSFQESLYNAGWAAMSEDCGSTSSLIGSLFLGMSEAAIKEELDPQEVASLFQAGLDGVTNQTKAKIGDKTLMDALIPAVEKMQNQANLSTAFREAAEAASLGAAETKDYVAKFGRARNLGERSRGHIDAGATSISYIFAEFAKFFG